MTKEEIYDSQINPLMAQIIAICHKHKIAMLASFSIPTPDDARLACTTALLSKDFEPPHQFLEAAASIRNPSAPPMHITVRDRDGEVVRMESIVP